MVAAGAEELASGVVLGLVLLMFLSFVMFSLTGRYPQLAFNLGNRTTIFGSLLVAYLIVLMPVRKIVRVAVFALLFFSDD